MTNLRAPEESTLRVQGLPTAENRWQVQCLNCEASLHGAFCSNCGQRAVPPHPTIRELVGDAFSEFSGWDGKFAETVRTLVRRPGELTRQWLEGRRVHFISPLRLYLTASLLFFVLQTSAPTLEKQARALTIDTRSAPGRASAAASKSMNDGAKLTPAEHDSAMAAVSKAPALMRPLMTRMIDDPEGMKQGLRRLVPRMFFALLPLYAGILALFYRRRHYPEHLYFAIHLHAFVFVALMFTELVKFTYQVKLAAAAAIAAFVWIAAYSLSALKNVYGGGWASTIAKGFGIMTLYFLIAMPVMLVTIYLAAVLT